jgi:nucleoside-diphosphate-sugar epimerase
MRILFVGGTGLISTACAAATVSAGHELWLLNRGRSRLPTAVDPDHVIIADVTDVTETRAAIQGKEFDVVVQWIAYRPEQIEQDLATFADAKQFIFISSASVYEKPPSHWMISESTPTVNPFWKYAQDKIACEKLLREAHAEHAFPVTIVRPSLTYGPSQIPVIVGSWSHPYTIVDRMRRGAPIIVPGDGTSIWTLTHNSDFAKGLIGLYGQPEAIGEDFHITSDEALSWDQIYRLVGEASGVTPELLHVPSDAIVAADPGQEGSLWGDKVYSTVFDNSKLRTVVPDFQATTPFAAGIRDTVAWFDADPSRRAIDAPANERWDRLVGIYQDALRQAGAGRY